MFKIFNPFYKLNKGLVDSKLFDDKPKVNTFGGIKYKMFGACTSSFEENFWGLKLVFGLIAKHFNIT